MLDQYGRTIDYMRISVTDRCNLRCRYCMPATGLEPLACTEILSYEEIIRLCRLFAELGIRKIKLTGGEPLVRIGICHLLTKLKQIPGLEEVTMTTNGILLAEMASELVECGIDAINISLDTLDAEKFTELTRWGKLSEVLAGIKKLQSLGYYNIKLNCVPMVGINEHEIVDMANFAQQYHLILRFIELMPIGNATAYTGVKTAEVKRRLEVAYGKLHPEKQQLGNGPAVYFSLPDLQAKIGFIDAIDQKFCKKCNRIRLTANGFLKLCLQYNSGIDLRKILRSDANNARLSQVMEKYIYRKPEEHFFYDDKVGRLRDTRNMFQVGG